MQWQFDFRDTHCGVIFNCLITGSFSTGPGSCSEHQRSPEELLCPFLLNAVSLSWIPIPSSSSPGFYQVLWCVLACNSFPGQLPSSYIYLSLSLKFSLFHQNWGKALFLSYLVLGLDAFPAQPSPHDSLSQAFLSFCPWLFASYARVTGSFLLFDLEANGHLIISRVLPASFPLQAAGKGE